jgi:pimeloyl-ACP methyl ester carboxylesterase
VSNQKWASVFCLLVQDQPIDARLLMLPDAGHGAQSQHAELFLANARLLLNSGN